jgi:hypothetical protein
MISARRIGFLLAMSLTLAAWGADETSVPTPEALIAHSVDAAKRFIAMRPYHLVISIGGDSLEDGFPTRVWSRDHAGQTQVRTDQDFVQYVKTQLYLGSERWSILDGMAIDERWEEPELMRSLRTYTLALQPRLGTGADTTATLTVKSGHWRGEAAWVVDQVCPGARSPRRVAVVRHTIRASDFLLMMRESFDDDGARLSFQRTEYATHEVAMPDTLFEVPTQNVTRYVAEAPGDIERIMAEHRAKRAFK